MMALLLGMCTLASFFTWLYGTVDIPGILRHPIPPLSPVGLERLWIPIHIHSKVFSRPNVPNVVLLLWILLHCHWVPPPPSYP